MKHEEYDVVIVEDNPADAEMMIHSLRQNRLRNEIIVLEDGEQAINYIFCQEEFADRKIGKPPKVIFLDLKLPKLNGLEVLDQIKSNVNTKKIPVIIVTSSKEDPDISRAYELGANSYVVKPVDYEEFVEKINNLGLYWSMVNENPV